VTKQCPGVAAPYSYPFLDVASRVDAEVGLSSEERAPLESFHHRHAA
jgi:hypothetical protein